MSKEYRGWKVNHDNIHTTVPKWVAKKGPRTIRGINEDRVLGMIDQHEAEADQVNDILHLLERTKDSATIEIEVCAKSGCTEISEALNELKSARANIIKAIYLLRLM